MLQLAGSGHADVAQLVEQCFRKAKVVGSIPTVGSRRQSSVNPPEKRQSCRFDVFLLEFWRKMNIPDQKPNNPKFDRWSMVNLAFDLGFVIALPLVALGLLGKYLDGRMGTEPWLTVLGILLAIATTTIWLTQKLKGYMKK